MKLEKTRITRVTPRSVEKTYNLTMRAPHHNYFANGVLTANSHSVAYAWVAYQTAYLKAHYPTHFWAAVMSNEIDNTTKIVKYITEAKNMGIPILSPDINISNYNFTPVGNAIRFGLGAIKGIGQSAVSSIIAARAEGGPFKSIFDFTERVEAKAANKRVLESLTKSGAFDSLGAKRSQLFAAIDKALESGARAQRDKESGQGGLFGMLAAVETVAADTHLPDVPDWTLEEQLAGEKETLGFYISGHPLSKYESALEDFCDAQVIELAQKPGGVLVAIGGTITSAQIKTTKKGDRFALVQLEDMTESVKVVVWPECYRKTAALLEQDTAVIVKGKLDVEDEGVFSVIADEIFALEGIYETMARGITLSARTDQLTPEVAERLFELLDRHRGAAEVTINLTLPDGLIVTVKPSQHVAVKPSPELSQAIKQMSAEFQIELNLPRTQGSFGRRREAAAGAERTEEAAPARRTPRVAAEDARAWWETN